MNRSKREYSVTYFKKVKDIPLSAWESLGCGDNIYFQPEYLESLELNNSQLNYLYAVAFNQQKEPVAFCSIQIIDFYLDSLDSNGGLLNSFSCFARSIKLLPKEKPLSEKKKAKYNISWKCKLIIY